MTLRAYKLIIPPGQPRELPPADDQIPGVTHTVDGFFAVVIASSLDQARSRLAEVLHRDGEDTRWIVIADVHELELVEGAVLIRGMV